MGVKGAVFSLKSALASISYAVDIPLVTPATVSPTYEQGQVRDAMITHLPLFCCRQKASRRTRRSPFRHQRAQKV